MLKKKNNSMHYNCLGCGARVKILIAFGRQPPSNRFYRFGEIDNDRHYLTIGQCSVCTLVQLVDLMPVAMVKPRYDWMTYNEPEGHLDALMDRLAKLPGISDDSIIAGLTYKDDTSIARLNRLGFINTFRLDVTIDLGLKDSRAGLESIQSNIGEDRAREIASRRGLVDLLLVRHFLEHTHDPRAFLAALKQLVKPGGYIVFEVPDSQKFLDKCDYSFVWEEHITYFSPATLKRFFEINGLFALDTFTYSYALEDSLVCIVKMEHPINKVSLESIDAELMRAQRFSSQFLNIRQRYNDRITEIHASGKKVAIFGAGHLAVKFLNLYDLGQVIECVIDDNPHKQGMLMPGSGLAIRNSKTLDKGEIDMCLLSLSPESEEKVVASKKEYLDNGGVFRSIFCLSPLALEI
jgi:hypothetical protein